MGYQVIERQSMASTLALHKANAIPLLSTESGVGLPYDHQSNAVKTPNTLRDRAPYTTCAHEFAQTSQFKRHGFGWHMHRDGLAFKEVKV